jgi:hypothetical protein
VRIQSLARVLFILLTFQLGIGLQVGVASVPVPAGHAMSITHDDACPMHSLTHGANPDNTPATSPVKDKHNCCKTSGCQSHCGSISLASNALPIGSVRASTLMRVALNARAPTSHADAHFRPPIAL